MWVGQIWFFTQTQLIFLHYCTFRSLLLIDLSHSAILRVSSRLFVLSLDFSLCFPCVIRHFVSIRFLLKHASFILSSIDDWAVTGSDTSSAASLLRFNFNVSPACSPLNQKHHQMQTNVISLLFNFQCERCRCRALRASDATSARSRTFVFVPTPQLIIFMSWNHRRSIENVCSQLV